MMKNKNHKMTLKALILGVILVTGIFTECKRGNNNSTQPSSPSKKQSKFVAIASDGKAAYSIDGIKWEPTTLPNTADWFRIIYGNGKFVAAAEKKAAYSDDGIIWKEATFPYGVYCRTMCYGSGRFIGLYTERMFNKVVYSDDGINWKTTILFQHKSSMEFDSVCYGNGKFIAGDYFGYNTASSSNGINWKILENTASWSSVTYGNDKFVAIYYHVAYYSTDGINWTETEMPFGTNWTKVCYGNGRFVAVAAGDSFFLDTIKSNYEMLDVHTIKEALHWYNIKTNRNC